MAVHKGFAQDDVKVDVYSDSERQADIKVVIRGNNLYINTGGRLNVVDETSNIEMVDEHYTAMDESYFDDNDFDYTACLPKKYKAKYTSVYRLSNMISSGWKTVKGFKRIKKFLMIGFVFAAMFAFLAVSNVLGLLEVKPVDYRTTNGQYLTVSNTAKTDDLIDLVGSLENVSFVIPGDSKKRVTLPMDDYLQTNYAAEDLTVSIVLTSVLKPENIVYGSMPADAHDVVLDKAIVDSFLRDGLGNSIGLDTIEEFIGRRIKVTNLPDYKIVGISDTESPSLFVDESQAMYILTNGDDADDEFAYITDDSQEEDLVKSGRVKDIDLATNKIKIKKGDAPKEAYETLINIDHEDEVKIGKTVPIKIAGRKLTVVGYYTSDSADDDTYYVHADTIKEDYIQKQKNFSAYAENPSLLKSILSKEGLSAKINDSRDKKAYINARKDQLTSAIIVAGIIMLISLIEMFLMLRSSFLSRIKEVGTLRAIGLKKKDIYRMFTGEILVMTFLTAIPGIALMYFGLAQVVKITYYLEGLYKITPLIAVVTFAIILGFNLLAGLIPVYSTMRKTPAQILARTDI